ncbi:hypothetical protein [Actinoplanes sp. NBRC 103695]|uniref:hypothetical protein n=1 Tax=Actinoplanes sp. NBRC 103695 TaxID=3032202 RepID=UPI0024A3785A|nr:hypothetical protein [Actinoplanes sp. NBRC 103695]GLZ00444.1 hypothetical protein Acsp02_76960 [Actinoplanes sp. NBRC 103695]
MTDLWFYPDVIARDLEESGLPDAIVAETLACAWEYTRCVIPQFTNWERYVAFTRIIVIGIVAEFRGSLVDVTTGDRVLGYDVDELLGTVFGGTPGHELMAREYRTFLLVTADKSSDRRDSELFRRYVNALVRSPRDWFRLRDCDALARFTIAAAMACNDVDDLWFGEEEFEILTELGDTLYDAVAYYKHRAEGETNSTFGYAGHEIRTGSFRRGREVLWALDVAWARSPGHRAAVNFLRYFGGPIHMMMRRYRFTEEGLTIGRPETDQVVTQTRHNVKLWNRIDATDRSVHDARYAGVLARSDRLMFPGLPDMLEKAHEPHCDRCRYRVSYGAEGAGSFGGVGLCDECRQEWQDYITSFPARAAEVFPVLTT